MGITVIRIVAVLIFALAASSTCYSANLEHCWAYSTLDLNSCMARVLMRAERYLALAERNVIEEIEDTRYHADEPTTTKQRRIVSNAFADAQTKWTRFRNADCDAVYKDAEEGTIRDMVYLQCMIARTEQRTSELQNWRHWQRKSEGGETVTLKKLLANAEYRLQGIFRKNFREIEDNQYGETQRAELKKLMGSSGEFWRQFRKADCEIPYRDNELFFASDETTALQCQIARTEQRILEAQHWNDWRF